VTSYEAGLPHASIEDEYLLSFWVRPHDGWTRHLRDSCLKSQSLPQLPAISKEFILLEGPYGMAEPLWAFDEVLLIAGGSGITAMVPYVLDHAERVIKSNKSNKSSWTRIRGLTLVWSDRKQAFLHRIAQQELAAALKRDEIRCMFYCTDPAKVLPSTDEISMGDVYKVTAKSSVLQSKEETNISEPADGICEAGSLIIKTGRPNIPTIIERAAASATKSGSRLAVMACGPGGMADAAREATYRAMRKHNNSIEYFEEAFGW
jgi:ferric-chelate reductase